MAVLGGNVCCYTKYTDEQHKKVPNTRVKSVTSWRSLVYIFLLERADASWRVSPALIVAIGGPTYGSNDEFHESSPIHLS